jgi:probable F420-dependent oxidoreductase
MQVGLFCLATDQMMAFADLAKEAEDRGFDVLLTGEHDHIPVGSQVWSGGDLPQHYRRILDPFVALTTAANATDRIKLGIAVCLVAQHDPISLAKRVASFDFVSDGRFIFGIGYGYILKEVANHGINPKMRRGILREKMLAIETIWSNSVASFAGTYVSFEDCEQYPKPVQAPRPPVLLGGKLREESIEHILEFCDGWIPSAMMAGHALATEIATLRERAERIGRDPASLQVTLMHTATSGDERDADNWGAAMITEDALARYRDCGVTTVCLPVPSKEASETIPLLDRYADIVAKFRN